MPDEIYDLKKKRAEDTEREQQKERLTDALYFAIHCYSGDDFSWEDGCELSGDEIDKCWEAARLNYQKTRGR